MNVLALAIARQQQMAIDGIHPLAPVALPAARVKSPAPATLFARLKTDVAKDAVPPSSDCKTVCCCCFLFLIFLFPNRGLVSSRPCIVLLLDGPLILIASVFVLQYVATIRRNSERENLFMLCWLVSLRVTCLVISGAIPVVVESLERYCLFDIGLRIN